MGNQIFIANNNSNDKVKLNGSANVEATAAAAVAAAAAAAEGETNKTVVTGNQTAGAGATANAGVAANQLEIYERMLRFVSAVSPANFEAALWTLKDGPPIRFIRDIALDYILKCLIRSSLQLKEYEEDELLQLNAELIKKIFSAPTEPEYFKIAIVQSVLALTDSSLVHERTAQFIEEIPDEIEKEICTYMVHVFHPEREMKLKFPRLKMLEKDKWLLRYEHIPNEIQQSCPSQEDWLFDWTDPRKGQKVDGPKFSRVLCLDGGGTKGLVAVEILDKLETYLHSTNERLDTCFDLIAGTSTGGLIALMLATGRTAREVKTLYFQLKDKIFGGPRPYDIVKYEILLKQFFTADKKMKDIKGINVAITSTYDSEDGFKLKMFTNFQEDTWDEEIWKVARRTSAAPSYFDPMTEGPRSDGVPKFYDGGLVANNPTKTVLIYLKQKFHPKILVSVGTGVFIKSRTSLPNVRAEGLEMYKMALDGHVKLLLDIFTNQITKTDGEVVDSDLSFCEAKNCQYYRLTPLLSEEVELNETGNEKLVNMIWQTKCWAEGNSAHFQNIATTISNSNWPPVTSQVDQ